MSEAPEASLHCGVQLRSRRCLEVRECRRLLQVLPPAGWRPGTELELRPGELATETGQAKIVQQAAEYIDQLHKELLQRLFPSAGDSRGVRQLISRLLPPGFIAAALNPCGSEHGRSRRRQRRAGQQPKMRPRPKRMRARKVKAA